MNLPSIRKNTQRKPVLPPSPTLQTVYFDAIPRLLIPLIVQPGAAPKYRQPDPDRTPAIELVERTQLSELTFQRSPDQTPAEIQAPTTACRPQAAQDDTARAAPRPPRNSIVSKRPSPYRKPRLSTRRSATPSSRTSPLKFRNIRNFQLPLLDDAVLHRIHDKPSHRFGAGLRLQLIPDRLHRPRRDIHNIGDLLRRFFLTHQLQHG